MKSIILSVILMFLLSYSVPLVAQFQISGVPVANRWGQTIPGGGNTIHAIGIGNFDDNTIPRARLHVNDNLLPYTSGVFGSSFNRGQVFRTDGPLNRENSWTLYTGNVGGSGFGTERFKLFVQANQDIVRLQATIANTNLLQEPLNTRIPNGALTFNVGNNQERVRITNTSSLAGEIFGDATRVGISTIPNAIENPLSSLHIGTANPFEYAGHRRWMNVGTYYKYGVWDNMYVGLKQSEEFPIGPNPTGRGEESDHVDAIINWGDNNFYSTPTPQPNSRYLGDHLRIIFTAHRPGGTGRQHSLDGFEVARFTPFGNVGIGNSFNSFMEPVRRLEILEDSLVAGDQPQLRLTHTKINNGTATGTFVDFQATGLGDLALLPFDGTTPRNVGIGIAIPLNTLDINGDLRIRQIANNDALTRVLVADNNGVVHWRNASSLGGAGTVTADNGLTINTPGNVQLGGTLIKHTTIETNGTPGNYYSLGIGDAISTTPLAPTSVKLSTQTIDNTNIALSAINVGVPGIGVSYLTGGLFKVTNIGSSNSASSSAGYVGVETVIDATNSCYQNALFYGTSQSTNVELNYGMKLGMYGNNRATGQNFGTSVELYGNTSTNLANYGNYVRLYGNSASVHNIGTFSDVGFGSNSPINIGVYGGANNSNPTGIAYAGYFNGDVHVNGNLTWTSDQMMKINVDTIANVKNIISQLKPKTFFYDTVTYDHFNFSSKRQYGLIAQQVETVLPELVRTGYHLPVRDSAGTIVKPGVSYKELNYNAFIAILIAGMQKQQAELDSVKSLLGMSRINSGSSGSTTSYVKPQQITLSNLDALVLDQNIPNPFEENTLITYRIPENIQNAYIIFYDQNGRVINKADIATRGDGKLQVYGSQLSKGIYTYSLVADGKVIDTKKMVKQ